MNTAVFPLEELGVITLLLNENRMLVDKRKHKRVHETCKEWKIKDEYAALFKVLLNDEAKFHKYFRMPEH
jgi:hypothetical protein